MDGIFPLSDSQEIQVTFPVRDLRLHSAPFHLFIRCFWGHHWRGPQFSLRSLFDPGVGTASSLVFFFVLNFFYFFIVRGVLLVPVQTL